MPAATRASAAASGAGGLLLLATAAATQAAAQDRPPVNPTRDVAVTYRIEGGGQSGEMRLAWLNAAQTLRADLPGGSAWSLTDMRSGRIVMVMDAQRAAMEIPRDTASGAGPIQPSPTARFTRAGTETILGQRCTIWRMEDGGHRGEACVTEDGVMLRSRGSSPGGPAGAMTATAIDLGPQDPARFRVPTDYRTMPMPSGPPPGGAPAGSPPSR
jgi:Domain of unknown function (DUF4412)